MLKVPVKTRSHQENGSSARSAALPVGSALRPGIAALKNAVNATDVARRAGVSQSAVSRAFTHGASVAPETRARIQEAAKQLGYRPNLAARSLITGRSHLVGVAVPGTSNPFYGAALDALSEEFASIGSRLVLFTSDPAQASDPVLEEVLRYRVDALVLISTGLSSRFAEECMQVGLPVVMLNRKTDSAHVSSVVGANSRGAQAIAAFLLAGQHRHFAYIAGTEQSSTSRDREDAFVSFLKAHGVGRIQHARGEYTYAGAQAAARKLLSSRTPTDAIFCANDHMALAAIDVARTDFALDVGRQISIVGFDDISMAAWPTWGLTTFSQPVEAMARQIVKMVQEQWTNPDYQPAGPSAAGGVDRANVGPAAEHRCRGARGTEPLASTDFRGLGMTEALQPGASGAADS